MIEERGVLWGHRPSLDSAVRMVSGVRKRSDPVVQVSHCSLNHSADMCTQNEG